MGLNAQVNNMNNSLSMLDKDRCPLLRNNFIICRQNLSENISYPFAARVWHSEKAYNENLYFHADLQVPSWLHEATLKRKSRYLAGRYLARLGLKTLDATAFDVRTGSNGEPIWPNGFVGSISHSGNSTVCAIVDDPSYLVGIDIEEIVSQEMYHKIIHQITNREERALLSRWTDKATMLTAIFSGKESLFKALFEPAQRIFGFRAVQLINWDANILCFELKQDLAPGFERGRRLHCGFALYERLVLTWFNEPYTT